MGEQPEDPAWRAGVNTPISALSGLLKSNGSYRLTSICDPAPGHGHELGARGAAPQELHHVSQEHGTGTQAVPVPAAVQHGLSQNGAKFKTRSVLIKATYTDFYPKGTGIQTSAVRVYLDNANKTRPATIREYSLSLQLKNVPNGAHTYTIKLVDRAGNQTDHRAQVHRRGAYPDAHAPRPCHGPRTIPARSTRP